MSTSNILRCSNTNCAYQTNSPQALATHLSQISTDGTRWKCQGVNCGLMFCNTQAMTEAGGYYDHSALFVAFRKARKYGRDMTRDDRLELMRGRVLRNGVLSNAPVADFSKKLKSGNSRISNAGNGVAGTKKRTTKSSTATATTKLSRAAKRQKTTKHDESTLEGGEEQYAPKKSTAQSGEPRAIAKRDATLKRKAVVELEAEDEKNEDLHLSIKEEEHQARKTHVDHKSRTSKRQKTMHENKELSKDNGFDDDDSKLDTKQGSNPSRKRESQTSNNYHEESPQTPFKAKKALRSEDTLTTKTVLKAQKRSMTTNRNGAEYFAQLLRGNAVKNGAEDGLAKEELSVLMETSSEREQSQNTKLGASLSTASHAEVDATPSAYGCSQCSIVHLTIEAAASHAEQSNEDMGRWECRGCGVALCHSEKKRLIPHLKVCEALKTFMMVSNIAWPRHVDEDFIAMADQKEKRRAWPARNDAKLNKESIGSSAQQAGVYQARYAHVTAKKAPSIRVAAEEAMTHPGAPRAFWYENDWRSTKPIHQIGRDAHALGAVGASLTPTATFEHPPEIGLAGDGHDGDWVYDLDVDMNDEQTLFGVSNEEVWGVAEEALL